MGDYASGPDSFASSFVDTYGPNNTPPIQWTPYYLLILLIYPILTALLRRDRLRTTLVTFPYTNRSSFASMTDNDAFEIQRIIGELEFPFTFEKALQFALFRTYGIPHVSKLLVATSQFSDEKTACKRYVDTETLVREFVGYAPASRRALEAISRMNYIHSGYQRSGKILNDNMLHTLSLFAGEPVRWIERYEWRSLEPFEKCAIGTFWKSVGDSMGVNYEKMRSAKEGWVDGLQWLEEVMDWGEEYEKEYMVPNVNNKTTADQTVNLLLWLVPSALKPVGRHFVSTLMDERLRVAMIYENPPQIYFTIISLILTTRKILIRHLFLPRPYFLRVRPLTDYPSKNGTYYSRDYVAAPLYVKPTIWGRWSPMAWMVWMMGRPLPGDGGDTYSPEGYKIPDLGPRAFLGKGGEFMRTEMEKLKLKRTGGCPFEGSKKS